MKCIIKTTETLAMTGLDWTGLDSQGEKDLIVSEAAENTYGEIIDREKL